MWESVMNFFPVYLQRNFTVSVVILAVFLARIFLMRFPKKYSYILWGIVGIRMVLDIPFGSAISLFNFLPSGQEYARIVQEYAQDWLLAGKDNEPVELWTEEVDISDNPGMMETDTADAPGFRTAEDIRKDRYGQGHEIHYTGIGYEIPEGIEAFVPFVMEEPALDAAGSDSAGIAPASAFIVWIALFYSLGVTAVILCGVASYFRYKKYTGQAVRLKRNIWECDHIPTPFVLGFWSPRIYIPFHMEKGEQTYIIRHEEYHIRRKDHWVKLAAFLLLALYWVNPLVWAAYFAFVRDQEMSCDEAVILTFGNWVKQPYSTSLLSFATGRRITLFSPIAFGESDASRRIKNVLNFKKPGFWAVLAGILFVAVIAVSCLTGKKEETEEESVAGSTESSGEVAAAVSREELDVDVGVLMNFQIRNGVSYYCRYEMLSEEELAALDENAGKGETGDGISADSIGGQGEGSGEKEKKAEGEESDTGAWENDWVRRRKLLCIKDRGYGEEVILTYMPDEYPDAYMLLCQVDSDGNWYNIFSVDSEGEENIRYEKYDARGNLVFEGQLDDFRDVIRKERLLSGDVTEEGELLAVTLYGNLFLWDSEGRQKGQISLWDTGTDNDGKGLVNAGKNGIYYYSGTDMDITLQKIDTAAPALEKAIIPAIKPGQRPGSSRIRAYGGNDGEIYFGETTGLWKYDFENDPEFLFAWADSNVNVQWYNVEKVIGTKDGVMILTYDLSDNTIRKVLVADVPKEEVTGKQVITLGCKNGDVYLSNLEPLVSAYNAQSDDYVIKLVKYGEISEYGGTAFSMDEIFKDVLNGKGPDLFDMTYFSTNTFVSKGILEDLNPYLEESGIELVDSVQEAFSIDGSFYTIPKTFSVIAMVSPEGYSTDGGMSIDQVEALAADYPDSSLLKYGDYSSVVSQLMDADKAKYVDYQNRTCNFESEEFLELLRFVKGLKSYSAESDFTNSANDLYQRKYLTDTVPISSIIGYTDARRAYSGIASIHGYPNYEGEPRYKLTMGNLFGMNAASGNKEGAWDFIKYILSEKVQKREMEMTFGFPIVKTYFEEALDLTVDDHWRYQSLYDDEITATGIYPTEEDKEQMRFIVEHVYYDGFFDQVTSIVWEEVQEYVAGDKTAEQVASQIQSRVRLYLSE